MGIYARLCSRLSPDIDSVKEVDVTHHVVRFFSGIANTFDEYDTVRIIGRVDANGLFVDDLVNDLVKR